MNLKKSLFKEVLRQTGVFVRLRSQTRDEAIEELVKAVADAGKLGAADPREVYRAVVDRENLGTTGFGLGIAAPRGRHEDLAGLVAAIGVLETGIDFKSLDRKLVDQIYLMLARPDQCEEMGQLNFISFHHYSRHESFREAARGSGKLDQILALMDEIDVGE